MIEKKKKMLERVIGTRYAVSRTGEVVNLRTGHKLNYHKQYNSLNISLWDMDTKRNYKYTKEQLIDWVRGKENIYKCKICGKWACDTWCDYCKEKLEAVRIVIKNAKK